MNDRQHPGLNHLVNGVMLRIGLAQLVCEKAAIEANLRQIARALAQAGNHDIQILAFPEMSITGYIDPALHPGSILRLDDAEIDQLLLLTKDSPVTVLAGLVEANPSGKPFITQVVARKGQLEGYYRKMTIRDEEELWFSPGDRVPVFQHENLNFGIAICADLHNERVFAECAQKGAQVVFECAAPGLYGEQASRDWKAGFDWWQAECQEYLSRYARQYGLWIAVTTQAGRTVDEDFPGGAFVFAPDGRRLYSTPDGAPGMIFLELDLERGSVTEL